MLYKKIVICSLMMILSASYSGASCLAVDKSQFDSIENMTTIESSFESDFSQYMGYGYITGDGVNLRTGPGTNYSSLGYMYKYNAVNVWNLGDWGWFWVYVDSGPLEGLTGYVSTDYVKITDIAR